MTVHPRTWVDVTGALIAAVADQWDGAVVPTVPKPRPNEFVHIRRTGGGDNGMVDQARMAIDVWSGKQGDSLVAVHELAATIREIVRQTPHTASGSGLSYVDVETFGYLPDEISGAPRIIITATVTAKPTAAGS